MNRHDGWSGLVFVVGLFIVAAMVSVPTAAESGETIKAFYTANRQVIILQQVFGALLLVPLLGFAAALDRRARARRGSATPRLLIVACGLAVVELGTNALPLAMAAMPESSPGTMHALTLIADLADAALFLAIALFSALAALAEPTWVRLAGFAVAAVTLVRAFASPLGATILDAAAPILFLAFVLLLSVRMLVAAERLPSNSRCHPAQGAPGPRH
jgi:hypothetical protein